MKELSIFKGFNKVAGHKTYETIAEIIRSSKYKEKIEILQNLLLQGKKKEYSNQKKVLPAFTTSGKFEGGRKMNFLKEYSKIIILDIDKLEQSQLKEIKQKSISNKYTYSCFISPSGKGLKILVKIDNSVSKHKETFLKIQAYYEKLLQVNIDPSGKDVTRLCFFSYDKDLYLNPQSETFKTEIPMSVTSDIEKLIEQIYGTRNDITDNYDDWLKIGFAIESEFGESGRNYYHEISRINTDYNAAVCNQQYDKCVKNNNSGITIKTLFHIAKQKGIVIKSLNNKVSQAPRQKAINYNNEDEENIPTSNKFTITENYLNKLYDVRYNVISNNFEYKEKDEVSYKEMNENNMFVRLQKDNINISLNHLIALLKSDFVQEYNPFINYFENLPKWNGETDYISTLAFYLKTEDRKRLNTQFKKWLVRVVKTSTDENSFNKQCFVLVSTKQNSGKSTFCRNLCPTKLNGYITEGIGTDKDSMVAITENFLINLDELSTAEKNEINAFKSMFSKDKVKARLTYDKRPTVHSRRASFIGSTDRWEFLTDENGSVRWLCFDITSIDWNYKKNVDIDMVWAQAYVLAKDPNFISELTIDEIKDNDIVNKKYQVNSPERDIIQMYLKPGTREDGEFMTATQILNHIAGYSAFKVSPIQIGRELKFLNYTRIAKKVDGLGIYGYMVIIKDEMKI
jgi:predicted P-loop ATPase